MAASSGLDIRRVSKSYIVSGRRLVALQNIDLRVEKNEFVAIVGASGCGKSTLLRLIVGLEQSYEGEILLDGERILGPSLDRGIVFQEHRLFPWLTAEQNIGLGLVKSALPIGERRRIVAEHLELVGLAAFARAYPSQLSGGMAQRIAIARALVNKPRILLLDEPFGALDALTRGHLQTELRRIAQSAGITTILVTHDVDEAIYLGDRVVVMQPGPGRISDILSVEIETERNGGDLAAVRLREKILAELGLSPRVPTPRAGRSAA